MADLIITERSNIVALADAIREKTGSTDNVTLGDMISDVEINIKSEAILQDKTVTPTTETQIITADSDYDGLDTVTINGDTNLKAENIAEGISIFGVEGTHGGGGSEIETCTVIINRNTYCYGWYTQYINNEKITTKFLGGTSSLNIENVLCNSSIVICDMSGGGVSPSINGDASLVCTLDFLMDYSTKPFIIMCGKGIIEITTVNP